MVYGVNGVGSVSGNLRVVRLDLDAWMVQVVRMSWLQEGKRKINREAINKRSMRNRAPVVGAERFKLDVTIYGDCLDPLEQPLEQPLEVPLTFQVAEPSEI